MESSLEQSIENSFKTTSEVLRRTFAAIGVKEVAPQSNENLVRFQYQMKEHAYIAEIFKSEHMVAVKIYGVIGKMPEENQEKALAYLLERNFILPTVSYSGVGDLVALGATIDPMIQAFSEERFLVTMRELAYYHHLEAAAWPIFLESLNT